MNKLKCVATPCTTEIRPRTAYINLYSTSNDGLLMGVEHPTEESAECHRLGRAGVLIRIERDENGDFTITKIKEYT